MRLRNVLTILVCIFLCGCTMNINMQKYDNISEESFKQTNAVPYEDRIWKPVVFEGSVDETGSVYPIDSIYAYGEQGYCYLGLQTVENTENIRYSDIRPVVNENGMQKEYVIFK